MKLNIGCGEQKLDGYIGLDKADYGQEIVRDLINGLPFSDNSIEEIYADSVLEHIEMNDDFIFIINECLRVLIPQGKMYIRCPHWRGQSRHKDLTHCRDFDEKSFSYLEPANRWKYGFDKRWKVDKIKNSDNQILEFWLIANK
jgi:SAM-dependent methyltransferase